LNKNTKEKVTGIEIVSIRLAQKSIAVSLFRKWM